jgi:hypothetical protein
MVVVADIPPVAPDFCRCYELPMTFDSIPQSDTIRDSLCPLPRSEQVLSDPSNLVPTPPGEARSTFYDPLSFPLLLSQRRHENDIYINISQSYLHLRSNRLL